MIYDLNMFWCYLTNESQVIINRAKELLTREDYDFDTKTTKTSQFFQTVSKINDIETIRFPIGLIKWVSNKLSLPVDKKLPRFSYFTETDVLTVANEVKSINSHFEIRDYQIEACLASLNNFESLIHSSVGSGKTSILSLVCKILENDKILIMNGNNFILQQIYDRLLSFGITDVSWNPSKEPDYSKRIVILNSKGSDQRLNKKDPDYLQFLKTVNTWITDEAQHFQSLTAFEPVFYMDDTKLRHIIGYSGSPFRNYKHPYNDKDDFVLIALLGEPVFTYEMKDTIADQNIAQPYAYFINYPNKEINIPPALKDNYFMQYRFAITYNKPRNRSGIEMLKFLNKHGIKTLASFNNIKPGQNMMKTLKQEGVNSKFICGDNTIHEWVKTSRGGLRLQTTEGNVDDIKQAFKNGYNIIFGSSVMDEGVDLEDFQAVVLFSAGKTPIAGIQRIGRASRKKKNGQNISFVIDFKDVNGNYVFRNHYEKRRQMMIDSGVKIIDKVQDFCKMVEELNKNPEE